LPNYCIFLIKETNSVDKMYFLSYTSRIYEFIHNKCHIGQGVNAPSDRDCAIHFVNMSCGCFRIRPRIFSSFFLFFFFFLQTHRRDCSTINHSPSDTPASLIPRASHCTICPFTLIHGDEGTLPRSTVVFGFV